MRCGDTTTYFLRHRALAYFVEDIVEKCLKSLRSEVDVVNIWTP